MENICNLCNKPIITLIKCDICFILLCCNDCLINHYIISHKEKLLAKLNIQNQKNKFEIHSNNDPNLYFYYKNFRLITKKDENETISIGNNYKIVRIRSKIDSNDYLMNIINKEKTADIIDIKKELKLSFMIKNANLIKCFSYSETLSNIYIILEHADNSLKNELVKYKTLSEISIFEISKSVIKALYFIHSSGVALGGFGLESVLCNGLDNFKLYDYKRAITKNYKDFNYYKSIDILCFGLLLLNISIKQHPLIKELNNFNGDYKAFYDYFRTTYKEKEIKFNKSLYSEAMNNLIISK